MFAVSYFELLNRSNHSTHEADFLRLAFGLAWIHVRSFAGPAVLAGGVRRF